MPSNASPTSEPTVEFWFDPVCPWTWITSRWAAEVAERRGFAVQWRPFSLQVLNAGAEPSDHDEAMRQGFRLGRVAIAVQELGGSAAVGNLYAAVGTRLHPEGRDDIDAILAESLAAAGLPPELAAAADDEAYDDALVASTRRGIDLVGPGVGIPIVAFDGLAFFGPVMSPAPTGEAAERLWDAVAAATAIPGFFELKRGRDVGPQFG